MRKSVFSRRTLIARSSSLIRPADRRSGVGTLDQGQSRGSDELAYPARRALCGLGSDRLRPLGGRIGTGADRAPSATRTSTALPQLAEPATRSRPWVPGGRPLIE